ncbi:hypothetical protein RJ639_040760, partial [Escallonia herrerae]
IIVLEDTNEYIGYAPKEETKAQDRRPFDLLVAHGRVDRIIWQGVPRAFLGQEEGRAIRVDSGEGLSEFWRACRAYRSLRSYASHAISVDGFRAVVERHLEVEVTGLDRDGQPIKVNASGWQARILQHECDHLEGTIYVDKMTSRTFRTVENLDLPLATGCPKLGVL